MVETLALPTSDAVVPLTEERMIDGKTVKLIALCGSGKTSYSLPTARKPKFQGPPDSIKVFDTPVTVYSEVSGSTETVEIESEWPYLVLDLSSEQHVLTDVWWNVRDDQNREIPTQPQGYGCCFFKTEPDAKSLRLTIIIHRWRAFEFFIKPPELSEGKPTP